MKRVTEGHLVSAGVASRRHSVIDKTVWKLLDEKMQERIKVVVMAVSSGSRFRECSLPL